MHSLYSDVTIFYGLRVVLVILATTPACVCGSSHVLNPARCSHLGRNMCMHVCCSAKMNMAAGPRGRYLGRGSFCVPPQQTAPSSTAPTRAAEDQGSRDVMSAPSRGGGGHGEGSGVGSSGSGGKRGGGRKKRNNKGGGGEVRRDLCFTCWTHGQWLRPTSLSRDVQN